MPREHPHARVRTAIRRDLVVIAGSAGSFEPLREIVQGLGGYEGTVLVVVHVPAHAPSALPALLSRVGTLPVRHAIDGEPLAPGTILVAPPDHHLLIEGDHVKVSLGPQENGARPAADPLFRTAARTPGQRVVGVVLSGALDDGTRGLAVVKACGGVAIVQRPAEARFPGMPRSAVENVDVDHVIAGREIAPWLRDLAGGGGRGTTAGSVEMTSNPLEVEAVPRDLARDEDVAGERRATLLSCPSCHGVLMRPTRSGPLHFSCQIGHAYSPLALSCAETEDTKTGLDSAYRSLRERVMLSYMMAERARAQNDGGHAAMLTNRAHGLEARAEQVRALRETLARVDDEDLTRGAEGGKD